MAMAEIPKGVADHIRKAWLDLQVSGLPYKPGDLIGQKYKVYGLLGAGGFGVVYLVYDHKTKSVLALKTHHDRYFKEAEAREVLRREAIAWVKLERHPYLVRAYWVDEISGRLYIAIEYIAPDEQGLNSLHGYLKRQPPDLAQSLRWSIQFCYGMEYARSKGIRCHGDIKPDNIMISDNTVKILDFGLARVVEEVKKVAWFVKEYTAPEIIQGEGADERSDIYSFGAVLYQMATSTPEPPLPERITNVNGPIKAIIRRCIEEEPDKRYQTFKELQGDLDPLLKKETKEVIKPPELKELKAWELTNAGTSFSHLNRFDEAISRFDKAIEINPRYAEAYLNRGAAYANKGEYDRAILDYNRVH
jgi:serine/threonine protein kinase